MDWNKLLTEKNVGRTDKIIRSVIILGTIVLGVLYSWLWYIVGAILLLTVLTSHCTPYVLLGINTIEKNKKK